MDDWSKFQSMEWEKYQANGTALGHFSVPEFHVTNRIALMLEKVEGPILDIGCGILPMPNYLRTCKQPIGIDPYKGHYRKFPFAQAMGEWLPFRDKCFNSALLMSSLDHVYEPEQVIAEAWRVLVENGLLFVWYINRQRVDTHHPWSFSTDDLLGWLSSFTVTEQHTFTGDRRVGFPKTEMVIGRKR